LISKKSPEKSTENMPRSARCENRWESKLRTSKTARRIDLPRGFALSGSDAAFLAARTAREQWREPPPFCFVRLSFVESREKDK
jgi:hypothetical protein